MVLTWGKRDKCVQTHLGTKAYGRDKSQRSHASLLLPRSQQTEELQERNHFYHHQASEVDTTSRGATVISPPCKPLLGAPSSPVLGRETTLCSELDQEPICSPFITRACCTHRHQDILYTYTYLCTYIQYAHIHKIHT